MQLTEKYRAGAEARCELKEEQESVGTLEESWRIVRANEKRPWRSRMDKKDEERRHGKVHR
jgi:hypothetical protein